jgi:hypothetical protein
VNMLMAKRGEPPRPSIPMFLTRNTDKSKTRVYVRELDFDIAHWKHKALPVQDHNGDPVESSSDKVWVLNNMVLKNNMKSCMTLSSSRISQADTTMPDGAVVFDALGTGVEYGAKQELERLFNLESLNPTHRITNRPDTTRITNKPHTPTMKILFLAAPKQEPIFLPEVLRTLRELTHTQKLHAFILRHANAIKNTIGAENNHMDECSLTLVKYERNCGLIAHIDGISDFGHTFGPIFTIAMSDGHKLLDLIPVATEKQDTSPPVRLITQQFQITMLQGCARAAYAHSVPFGIDEERYTIAFKFPEITSAKQGPVYHCSKLDAYIKTIAL